MGWILFIVLLLLLAGSLPRWPYSRKWGYGPSGVLGLLLAIQMALLIFNVMPRGF